MVKCLVMFSGGLDSTITIHLLKSQNVDVTALHYILPFYSGLGFSHTKIRAMADALGVPIRVEEEGEEFLPMLKSPEFGYGKNVNPCLDCRIYRLTKAKRIMEETGAAFIATGEVVGQRPMSQRLDCLHTIENRTGLKGRLLRPLSAGLLDPTIPEQQGWVDRTKLLSIHGRGRKIQLAYARQFSLNHLPPAGGCLLTHSDTTLRYNDLYEYNPDFDITDFKLLAWGRHFRLSPKFRLIVSRDEQETEVFLRLVGDGDYWFEMADILGPIGIGKGAPTPQELDAACGIMARFSREKQLPVSHVKVRFGEREDVHAVAPAAPETCEKIQIKPIDR